MPALLNLGRVIYQHLLIHSFFSTLLSPRLAGDRYNGEQKSTHCPCPHGACVRVCEVASVVSNSSDPIDCSLPGSSVHGILQARIPEWVAMPSSRGSSQPRDRTPVSSVPCLGKQVLYHQSHPIYLFILGCAAWHCGILAP